MYMQQNWQTPIGNSISLYALVTHSITFSADNQQHHPNHRMSYPCKMRPHEHQKSVCDLVSTTTNYYTTREAYFVSRHVILSVLVDSQHKCLFVLNHIIKSVWMKFRLATIWDYYDYYYHYYYDYYYTVFSRAHDAYIINDVNLSSANRPRPSSLSSASLMSNHKQTSSSHRSGQGIPTTIVSRLTSDHLISSATRHLSLKWWLLDIQATLQLVLFAIRSHLSIIVQIICVADGVTNATRLPNSTRSTWVEELQLHHHRMTPRRWPELN